MSNDSKNIYSDDLLAIIEKYTNNLENIKSILDCKDDLINKGLFLMATSYFEATLRNVTSEILRNYPGKLKGDIFTIDKAVLCDCNDYEICKNIIDKELFNFYKGNVKEQLLYIIEITSNIKSRTLINKHNDIINVIAKCRDISIFRNALIHNEGKLGNDFSGKLEIYKYDSDEEIPFSTESIIEFINVYLEFFCVLKEKILKNIEFRRKTGINQLRYLWSQCFDSPILMFDDYWSIDEERDLVVNIKYPNCEGSISISEKVYLSIWRHQYYDSIPTEEFLICSVNSDTLSKIYKGLAKVKFYHMYQQAHPL